ncbi:hypothetical protein NE237_008716 [Protea cynaroides]|uniref:Uncharacterized protein n=1 Tax=Protea cynaroides TaxID=273540 RepID=A0A9Q0KWE5_9MAGN|nr:hypothetical protein NE237_008716 [Protea cynaroides]
MMSCKSNDKKMNFASRASFAPLMNRDIEHHRCTDQGYIARECMAALTHQRQDGGVMDARQGATIPNAQGPVRQGASIQNAQGPGGATQGQNNGRRSFAYILSGLPDLSNLPELVVEGGCKENGNVPGANNESSLVQVHAMLLVPSEGLKEVWPSVVPKPVSPFRAIVGHLADAEDDDDFGVEHRRVEVVYGDILAMDEALQTTVGAFAEVGKRHRRQPIGRGICMGLMLPKHLMRTLRILLP